MPKSTRRKITPKQVFERILMLRCFGHWDCLIRPDEANPYYSSIGAGTLAEVFDACHFAEECSNVKCPGNSYFRRIKEERRKRDEEADKRK
jgi:hypothetical protein